MFSSTPPPGPGRSRRPRTRRLPDRHRSSARRTSRRAWCGRRDPSSPRASSTRCPRSFLGRHAGMPPPACGFAGSPAAASPPICSCGRRAICCCCGACICFCQTMPPTKAITTMKPMARVRMFMTRIPSEVTAAQPPGAPGGDGTRRERGCGMERDRRCEETGRTAGFRRDVLVAAPQAAGPAGRRSSTISTGRFPRCGAFLPRNRTRVERDRRRVGDAGRDDELAVAALAHEVRHQRAPDARRWCAGITVSAPTSCAPLAAPLEGDRAEQLAVAHRGEHTRPPIAATSRR